MPRYDLDNLIKEATNMDTPSTLPSKQPRWQRKNDSQTHLTPSGKTPNPKTPNAKTPSRHNLQSKGLCKTPKTPIHGMDRFIPNRSAMDLEISHYLMTQANKNGKENELLVSNENEAIREKLGSNLDQYRIMCYTDKAPVAAEGQAKNSMVLYSNSKGASAKKNTRYIPSQPEKILDAPDLQNDFYLSLIDWSSSNVLAVALNSEVYLWNAVSGDIKQLCAIEPISDPPEYVSSLSWIQDGNQIAIGNSLNDIEIWDVEVAKRLRIMRGHTQRVNSLNWNAHLLTSGSKSGLIFHSDVRVSQHHIGTLNGHSGHEVCGLRWSADGKYLASGGNDNSVNIWLASGISLDPDVVSPIHTFNHMSCVKALAWCPWKPHLLATGGGQADRNIRIFNTLNGNCLCHLDAKSQVSGLEWSEEHQELISAHGFENYELNIWKYPSLTKVSELRGHTNRILGMAMSPDRTTVVSLGADETLRFWECFQVDPQKKKKTQLSASKTFINPIRMSLR